MQFRFSLFAYRHRSEHAAEDEYYVTDYPARLVSFVELVDGDSILDELVQSFVVTVDARVEHRQLRVVVVISELRVDTRPVVRSATQPATTRRRRRRRRHRSLTQTTDHPDTS